MAIKVYYHIHCTGDIYGDTFFVDEQLKALQWSKLLYSAEVNCVITGENRKELENSPYLEAFKAKDIEVLFLTDPIDEWVIMSAPEFKDKSFKAINKGNIDLGAKEEEKAEHGHLSQQLP